MDKTLSATKNEWTPLFLPQDSSKPRFCDLTNVGEHGCFHEAHTKAHDGDCSVETGYRGGRVKQEPPYYLGDVHDQHTSLTAKLVLEEAWHEWPDWLAYEDYTAWKRFMKE